MTTNRSARGIKRSVWCFFLRLFVRCCLVVSFELRVFLFFSIYFKCFFLLLQSTWSCLATYHTMTLTYCRVSFLLLLPPRGFGFNIISSVSFISFVCYIFAPEDTWFIFAIKNQPKTENQANEQKKTSQTIIFAVIIRKFSELHSVPNNRYA